MLGRSQKIKGPEDSQREAVNAVNEPEEALVLGALGGRQCSLKCVCAVMEISR
jgi:hypothetical protein